MKKYVAIILLYTAFGIILGHNVLAHHHHSPDEQLTGHHGHRGHHHHDQEDAGGKVLWSHLFSDIAHPQEELVFTTAHGLTDGPVSPCYDYFFILFSLVYPELDENGYATANLDIELFYTSYYLLIPGLRAPPVTKA